MRDVLNPFSYVILTLVGRGGASAHDIVLMMRRGRAYWAAAESHYYAEPKRLAQLGYLEVDTAPGKTTQRRVYSLTAKGERALHDWLGEPTGFPRIQSEAVVRMLAAEYTDQATLLASLTAMRADLEEIEGHLTQNIRAAEAIPHRSRSIRLVSDLGLRMVAAHREWLATVEAEFAGDTGP